MNLPAFFSLRRAENISWPNSHSRMLQPLCAAILCVAGIMLGLSSNAPPLSTVAHVGQALQTIPDFTITSMLLAGVVSAIRMVGCMALACAAAFASAGLVFGRKNASATLLTLLRVLRAAPLPTFYFLALPFCAVLLHRPSVGMLAGEALICAPVFAAFAIPLTMAAIEAHQKVPDDLVLASRSFGLYGWSRFWRLYAPFSVPSMAHAANRAMKDAWCVLAFTEFCSTALGISLLPGLGTQTAFAAIRESIPEAASIALVAAVLVIFFNQMIMAPLMGWSSRFEAKTSASHRCISGFWKNISILTEFFSALTRGLRAIGNLRIGRPIRSEILDAPESTTKIALYAMPVLGVIGLLFCAFSPYGLPNAATSLRMLLLGFAELFSLLIPILLYSVLLLPLAVHLRPYSNRLMLYLRFFTLFPAVLLFPFFVDLTGSNSIVSPILFVGLPFFVAMYVLTGARNFPNRLLEVASSYEIRGWLRWKTILLPGLAESWLQGVRRAFVWAWNVTIAADVIFWGNQFSLHGFIGPEIMKGARQDGIAYAVFGCLVMTLLAIGMDFLVWEPLSGYVHRRINGKTMSGSA
ncbi:ABC transporter permease subunit [Acetobacter sp.]|uniref:ABC transporter permease subunit n=1 Tax=Acetobacter sp. TaxID=440 RepID=UPI0039E7A343